MPSAQFRVVGEPRRLLVLVSLDDDLPCGTLDSRDEVDALIASLDAAAEVCFGPRQGAPR